MTIVDPQLAGAALAVLICVQVLFQAALPRGLPWGAAAWDGSHDGVHPAGLLSPVRSPPRHGCG
jgi:hypothetical protein